MHNGVVCIVGDKHYVPKLKKNFIYPRTLNDIRCKYNAKGGVPKIYRSAMVVMKGKKVNTLYHLLKGTVIEAAVISSGESNFDLAQLQLIRMRYMSEIDITMLSERGSLKGWKIEKLNLCEQCILGTHCIFGK